MNDTPAIQLKYVSKTYRVGKQTLPVLKKYLVNHQPWGSSGHHWRQRQR